MFPSQIPTAHVVKSTVRAALKDRFFTASVAALCPIMTGVMLYVLLGGLAIVIPGRFEWALLLIFIGCFVLLLHPVILGAVRYFWRFTDGITESPTEVFHYFSNVFLYTRALKCILLILFKFVTAVLTCMLPYLVVTIISNAWLYQFLGKEIPLWVAGLSLLQSFLKFVGIIASLAVISRYYLFPAVAVMDDETLLLEAVHISVMVSRHTVTAFLGLIFSLLGWIILSNFWLPLVYTAPLLLGSYVVHSRYAIVNYNQSLEFYAKENY